MKVEQANIFRLLNGSSQFIIPVYQRRYNWGEAQCSRLWYDIVEMYKPQSGSQKKEHFIGSIVNISEENSATDVARFTIIDGQQRITTLTILLLALRDYLIKHPDESITVERIEDSLLKNKHESDGASHKLVLTARDEEVLNCLMEKIPLPDGTISSVLSNYKFFAGKIEGLELKPLDVYNSIKKLQIVNITLKVGDDDAQVIFESLNSTGKDLSSSDLIRNYLLMGLDENEHRSIYDRYWNPMEGLFPEKNQEAFMTAFFRDYLTMKLARIVNKGDIYDEFKDYRNKGEFKDKSNAELCQDIYTFAKYFTDIAFCKSDKPKLESLYIDIVELGMTVSYPFLIKAHDDCKRGIINENELEEIMRLCISYVIRRKICCIPSNALNNIFATLRNTINEGDYMNSLKAFFVLASKNKEFPNDEKFKSMFATRNIFKTNVIRFILNCLQEYKNKGKTDLKRYSIEHIMPRTLTKQWKDALGDNWREVHDNYLHTIGNLTLTAYNREWSNKPFMEKMTMKDGFQQSALRLNEYLFKQTEWNETHIKARADELTNEALEMWPYPQITQEALEPYKEA